MITEDYVSFETAKLLKEKGFNELCYQKYDSDGELSFNHVGYVNSEKPCDDFYALAPTLQMAMKWLREKGIEIIVYPFSNIVEENMLYTADICTSTLTRQLGHLRGIWKTYEEAVEAALKYCLENLI